MIRFAVFVACLLSLLFEMPDAFAQKERIVSKADADEIFALERAAWEDRARQFIHPQGWVVRLRPVATGTAVMSFDRATGMGLAIQPLFGDDLKSPPHTLIVTSTFSVGGPIPVPDERDADHIEREAMADLGESYNVKVRVFDMSPRFRSVEIMITRK